ncbi:MAG: DNA polymerase III subunit gamma/tau [Bacillota bacterium]|nr:DNA polymerase III subunit gamma/tau [Bacillota bacterium]
MAYQALYRKWRPLVFSDVSSQEHVTQTLKHQVETNHLSHAYLFTGTRGTGKTTCAKILSRAVNCENPQNGDPCNECPSCKGILSGSILDVLEIDAASNNGVDNIRDIRDEVVYTPASVKKRVYIIDEVHMLSAGAFNALLKTLEEPPEHVLFILATTEIQKVPATILSRCQRFDFVRVRPEDISARLMKIADGEGIKLCPDAASKIARFADGSMRDAISIFDRCISGAEPLTSERLSSVLGLADKASVLGLVNGLAVSDLPSVLEIFYGLYKAGVNIPSLFDELLAIFRDLLIIKLAPQKSGGLISPSYEMSDLAPIAERMSLERLLYISGAFSDALSRVQKSGSRATDAEMCFIRLCAFQENTAVSASPALSAPSVPAAQPYSAPPLSPSPAPKKDKKPEPPKNETAESGRDWDLLVSKLATKVTPSVFAHLNLAQAGFSGNKIEITVEPEAIDFVNHVKVKSAIQEAAKALYHEDFSVLITAQRDAQPIDPRQELIKNARLGGVNLEIK